MKDKECVNCHKINHFDNANFCMYCGSPLYNCCQNNMCPLSDNVIVLPDDAVFCPECGTETVFKSYGLVSEEIILDDKDLPF